MIEFTKVRSSLKYVVNELIPSKHGYIVNINAADFDAPRLQVVAQGMIERNHNCGLSVHLPFDMDSGQHDNLLRFLELDLSATMNRCDVGDIPCFYANFGCDYEYADRVILQLLIQLYQYSPSDSFICEVYDQGPIGKIQTRQAPPGGTVV